VRPHLEEEMKKPVPAHYLAAAKSAASMQRFFRAQALARGKYANNPESFFWHERFGAKNGP
jgi:hypothetical protein